MAWMGKWQPDTRPTYMPLPLSWKTVKSSEAKEGQFQAVEFFTYAFSLLSPIHVLGQNKSKDTIKKKKYVTTAGRIFLYAREEEPGMLKG